jgi:hypothetical protein
MNMAASGPENNMFTASILRITSWKLINTTVLQVTQLYAMYFVVTSRC